MELLQLPVKLLYITFFHLRPQIQIAQSPLMALYVVYRFTIPLNTVRGVQLYNIRSFLILRSKSSICHQRKRMMKIINMCKSRFFQKQGPP